jgi:hypothetical protein
VFESIVNFSLATAGSLVGLSAPVAVRFVARKTQSATIGMAPVRGESPSLEPQVDPVYRFGFILACYGAIALAAVTVLPGALALERTGLAFALLCVGGLIGEISNTRQSASLGPTEDVTAPRKSISLKLSVGLMLALNLAFDVLGSGQGLLEVVPPTKAASAGHSQELAPIIVVAQRKDPIESQAY